MKSINLLSTVIIFAFLMGLFQALMVILKLAGIYNESWVIVLMPLGLPILILLCVAVSFQIFALLSYIYLALVGKLGIK